MFFQGFRFNASNMKLRNDILPPRFLLSYKMYEVEVILRGLFADQKKIITFYHSRNLIEIVEWEFRVFLCDYFIKILKSVYYKTIKIIFGTFVTFQFQNFPSNGIWNEVKMKITGFLLFVLSISMVNWKFRFKKN